MRAASFSFLILLFFVCTPAAQETAPASAPTPTPQQEATPVSADASAPAPAPAPAEPTAEPAPPAAANPPPSPTELLNTLSTADLQEALSLLKANYIHPERLSDEELSRALLQGIMHRLDTGVLLLAASEVAGEKAAPHPFLAEMLDERIGYVRPGELSAENIGQLDSALDQFNTKNLKAVVLDLRATPPGSDLESAVEVIKRFVPKGRLLFTVRKPSEKQERIFTSNQDPKFQGLTMILIDGDTAGSAEIVAAAVRAGTKSMLVGSRTAGQAVEYEDRKLKGGRILRVAVAEVVVSDSKPIFPDGLAPDLDVELSSDTRDEIFRLSKDKGVSQFVFDKERPRMNEAALVAGTFPELDAYQAEQNGDSPSRTPPRDAVLQRAIDLITTISIYEGKM